MPYFPGLPQMLDARFIDAGGNVATVLDIQYCGGVWFVIALCKAEGKLFTMTLERWNETYTSIDSKAYKQQVHDKIQK